MSKPANLGKPRCPKCQSAWVYYRQQKEEHVCRVCQHIWKDDNMKGEVKVASASNDAKD